MSILNWQPPCGQLQSQGKDGEEVKRGEDGKWSGQQEAWRGVRRIPKIIHAVCLWCVFYRVARHSAACLCLRDYCLSL